MQVIEENLHTKNSHTVPTFNVHCVPKKTGTLSQFNNFVNFQRIFIIVSLTHSAENLQ